MHMSRAAAAYHCTAPVSSSSGALSTATAHGGLAGTRLLPLPQRDTGCLPLPRRDNVCPALPHFAAISLSLPN
ncbi:hypothetical protein PSPO01_13616 [Paraphaeosphaeria sporulosa]